MNDHPTRTRFSSSPELAELDGRPADCAHPQALAFALINGEKVLTTGRPHFFIFNALTTLALPEQSNDLARDFLQRAGPGAFLRDFRVRVWPSALTEADLQWFREHCTGDLNEMRARTRSGRVWAEAEHRGGMVTLFSFWAAFDDTLLLLCDCLNLNGAAPIGVEFMDSPHPALYSPALRRTIRLESKAAPELSPREIIDLLVQGHAAVSPLTAREAAVFGEFEGGGPVAPTRVPRTPQQRRELAGWLRRQRTSRRYSFRVADKNYTMRYVRLNCLDGYDDAQLARLAASKTFEVSFRLEDYTLADGSVVRGCGAMGKSAQGHAFQVLGGVANGIVAWAQRHRPDYLYWFAHSSRFQRLYARMIECFAARGSGWRRLEADPFTGRPCAPEAFWLGREPQSPADLAR